MGKKYITIALVSILFLHLFILSQLQFTAWPEMVSFPYFINRGFVTFTDMIHAYPPLLINVLAILYKIFGYNVWVLKIFGWASFIINDVLIFVLLKKLIKNENLAVVGVLSYVILQPILDGNMVWPDLVIIPFLLLGFLFLIEKKYFWSGVIFAFGFLTKQTVGLYVICSILYILFSEKKAFKKLINFLVGGLIISLPFLVSLIYQKSLMDFVNWTIFYPSKYWTKFPGYVQLNLTLRENLILLILFLPYSILLVKSLKQKTQNKEFYLLFGFLICGIIGVYPRFSFFHFQSALAFLVISFFYFYQKMYEKFNYWLLFIPLLVVILSFKSFQLGETRFWNKNDIALSEIIKNQTPSDKPIYLLGLNSNLYTLAERLPNKPWLDNFGWYLEIPGAQEKVIQGFEVNKPSAIFWATPSEGNWYDIGTYQPKMITDWIVKNYTKKAEIQKGIWEWVRKD